MREPTRAVPLATTPSSTTTKSRKKEEKGGPWFELLLGNWGSYAWNVSPCVCNIPPCKSPTTTPPHPLLASLPPLHPPVIHRVIQFVFVPPRLNYVFPLQEKSDVGCPWWENNKRTFWVCLSNCYLIVAGGADICSSPAARRQALPFTKPGDATHILFVLHEQTDCKLADNFRTDNVIYGCQPFVGSVCFIQIWTEWTFPSAAHFCIKITSIHFHFVLSEIHWRQSLGWMPRRCHGDQRSHVDFRGI